MCLFSFQVVILDEPTLHMDPDSRRIVWDALFQEKKGKAIFLTTSNIKEANTLADRLAVIHGGHLVCYGSPLFLKKKYGIFCVFLLVDLIFPYNKSGMRLN